MKFEISVSRLMTALVAPFALGSHSVNQIGLAKWWNMRTANAPLAVVLQLAGIR
jgi:hypothetical protein